MTTQCLFGACPPGQYCLGDGQTCVQLPNTCPPHTRPMGNGSCLPIVPAVGGPAPNNHYRPANECPCSDGMVCNNGTCVDMGPRDQVRDQFACPRALAAIGCAKNADCPPQQTCQSGMCVTESVYVSPIVQIGVVVAVAGLLIYACNAR